MRYLSIRAFKMKHHIVIECGSHIVENMMSKIATPKELRARLAKKYPGKYRLYFRTLDSQHGWFCIDDRYTTYFWFIDSNPEKRQKRPEPIPEKQLIRKQVRFEFDSPIQNPYGIYKGDVFTIPPLENIHLVAQRMCKDSPIQTIMVTAILNGRLSWLSLSHLRRLDHLTQREALEKFAGKTIRITEAIQYACNSTVMDRGLLTGKPLTWWLRPIEYPGYKYTYEIVQ